MIRHFLFLLEASARCKVYKLDFARVFLHRDREATPLLQQWIVRLYDLSSTLSKRFCFPCAPFVQGFDLVEQGFTPAVYRQAISASSTYSKTRPMISPFELRNVQRHGSVVFSTPFSEAKSLATRWYHRRGALTNPYTAFNNRTH